MNELPDECLLHVFQYLAPCELFNCAVVCRRFYAISVDNHLWAQFLEEHLHVSDLKDPDERNATRRRRLRDGSSLKFAYRRELEGHVNDTAREIWDKDVVRNLRPIGRGNSCFWKIGAVVLVTSVLIWVLIHNGEHATSADFQWSFDSNWGEFCSSTNAPPSLGIRGNDIFSVILMSVVLVIWAPYMLTCWVYPAFYWVLYTAEFILSLLGNVAFGWMFARSQFKVTI